ncbi:hypothetical protein GGC47_003184 [Bosea sp. OAE752]|uniref:host specificity factor TipJ family phage tail protein n=1 Tax=Bosea sp. OAE752 TaxID=2663873 RepID=UPI003D210A8C
MTNILFQRCDGKPAGSPIELPRARRRLSALVRRHADHSRPHIVSVHRRGELPVVTDMSVRLRRHWSRTLVGPRDMVLITYLPRGGGGASGSSRGGKGASIGLLVATIALAAVGQFWAIGAIAPLVGGSMAVAGTIWAGVAATALAGGAYLMSRATKSKANKSDDRPVYGVSGGGNLPRLGDRIPVIYGRCWTSPDLSQPDYTVYVGDDSQELYKRLTIGCGKYLVKTIRVAGAVMWTPEGGITPPFTGSQIEVINPGTVSGLVPGQVASIAAIGSNQLPYVDDTPSFAGPFSFGPGAPAQRVIQIDFSLPEGCFAIVKGGKYDGKQYGTTWGVLFEYAPCDLDGNPIGPFQTLWTEGGSNVLSTRPMRFTRFATIPAEGQYTYRARNIGAPKESHHEAGFIAEVTNTVRWEGLRTHIPQAAVRPGITELAMKIHAGPELAVTSFGDVEVEVSRILPVWDGTGWTEQETQSAAWAAVDAMRDGLHGGGIAESAIELSTFRHYATAGAPFNTFSGILRGPVSLYEALSTILGAMRASPLRLGRAWTMVRDEPQAVRKHVISRRRILKDTTGIEFNLDLSDGSADIVVEWYTDGDPKRLRTHRVTFGSQTPNPRRMQAFGATSAEHAIHLATWAAAIAYYRRQKRSFTMEFAGRMLKPNDSALVDAWFFDPLESPGIVDAEIDREAGRFAVIVDSEVRLPEAPFAYLRGRDGLEWGPVGISRDGDWLLLNAEDVEQAESLTGLALEQVLNTQTQSFTDLVIGTLPTLQEAWLIRSIQFDGETRVNLAAVQDAPEVWTALAEPIVPPPPPPSSGLENEASATLAYVQGKAVQQGAAVYMRWAVGRSRAAASYQVVISYDNWLTSEAVYLGPSSSGSYPLRDVDTTIRIRARGITAAGVAGAWVENAFSSVKAVIDLSGALNGSLAIQAFLDSLQPPQLVDALPDLFEYEGSKVVALIRPGEKPRLYYLSDDRTQWLPQAAEDYVAGTITSIAIQAGAIVTQHLGALQVTSAKIAAGAITADKIAANSIVAGNIVAGTITADRIISGGVGFGGASATGAVDLPNSDSDTAWYDYATASLAPQKDGRALFLFDYIGSAGTRYSNGVRTNAFRIVRRKFGVDTVVYGETQFNTVGFRFFRWFFDQPGAGAVQYVCQHRFVSQTGSNSGFTYVSRSDFFRIDWSGTDT